MKTCSQFYTSFIITAGVLVCTSMPDSAQALGPGPGTAASAGSSASSARSSQTTTTPSDPAIASHRRAAVHAKQQATESRVAAEEARTKAAAYRAQLATTHDKQTVAHLQAMAQFADDSADSHSKMAENAEAIAQLHMQDVKRLAAALEKRASSRPSAPVPALTQARVQVRSEAAAASSLPSLNVTGKGMRLATNLQHR